MQRSGAPESWFETRWASKFMIFMIFRFRLNFVHIHKNVPAPQFFRRCSPELLTKSERCLERFSRRDFHANSKLIVGNYLFFAICVQISFFWWAGVPCRSITFRGPPLQVTCIWTLRAGAALLCSWIVVRNSLSFKFHDFHDFQVSAQFCSHWWKRTRAITFHIVLLRTSN